MGAPPEQHAPLAYSMQERGGGGNPYQKGERGVPPEQERAPFVRGLIQEMGGGDLDL